MDRVSYSVHSDIYSIDGVWSSIRLTIVVLDFFCMSFRLPSFLMESLLSASFRDFGTVYLLFCVHFMCLCIYI